MRWKIVQFKGTILNYLGITGIGNYSALLAKIVKGRLYKREDAFKHVHNHHSLMCPTPRKQAVTCWEIILQIMLMLKMLKF